MMTSDSGSDAVVYKVSGMTCGGCVRSVQNAIARALPAVAVAVRLAEGEVEVTGPHGPDAVAAAVDDAGFEFGGVKPS